MILERLGRYVRYFVHTHTHTHIHLYKLKGLPIERYIPMFATSRECHQIFMCRFVDGKDEEKELRFELCAALAYTMIFWQTMKII